MLYVGDDPISKLYLGDDEISELYQGNDPIYSSDNSAVEEKIVLQLLSDENSYVQFPTWNGIHFRVYGYDGSSDEGDAYNMSGPTGEGRGPRGSYVNNPRNVYFVEYTPITDGSYEGHTEPWYGWAKGMCSCGQNEYQGYGYPRVTRIVYDKTYMGFADSATNTGDNFRAYQYCNMQNLQNCAPEYLPDTVTSIGESFRNMQYAQAGIVNVAAEFMPNSVTYIGGNFRIYQYYLCHNLIEAAYEIISPNVSTIENHFRFGQYCDCPNITSAVPERLPNVTSISYNFRGQQYMSTGVRKSADEYIPNTVTSIGSNFRTQQYEYCYSLSEVGQLSNGGNNTIIDANYLREHQFENCGYIQEIEIPSLKRESGGPYFEVLKGNTENLSKMTVHVGTMNPSIIGFIQNAWGTASSVTNFTLKIIGGYGVMTDDYYRRSEIVTPQGTRYLDVPSYLYNDYLNSDWANYFTIIQHQEQAPTSFINITSINTTSPSPINIGSISGNFEVFPSSSVASPHASGQSTTYGGTACCVGNINRTFEVNNITEPGTYTLSIEDSNNPGLFDTEQVSLGGCEYGKISPIANDSNPTYANIEYYNAFHGEEHSGYHLYIISPYQDVTTLVVNTTDSNVAYIDNITTYSVSGSAGEYSYASIWLQCINTGIATLTYYTLVHPDDVRTLEVTVGNPIPPTPSFSPTNSILVEPTRGNANLKFFAENDDSENYVSASLSNGELTNITYHGLCEGDEHCEGMFGNSDICSSLANNISDLLDNDGAPESGSLEFNEAIYYNIEKYFDGEVSTEKISDYMSGALEIVYPKVILHSWSNIRIENNNIYGTCEGLEYCFYLDESQDQPKAMVDRLPQGGTQEIADSALYLLNRHCGYYDDILFTIFMNNYLRCEDFKETDPEVENWEIEPIETVLNEGLENNFISRIWSYGEIDDFTNGNITMVDGKEEGRDVFPIYIKGELFAENPTLIAEDRDFSILSMEMLQAGMSDTEVILPVEKINAINNLQYNEITLNDVTGITIYDPQELVEKHVNEWFALRPELEPRYCSGVSLETISFDGGDVNIICSKKDPIEGWNDLYWFKPLNDGTLNISTTINGRVFNDLFTTTINNITVLHSGSNGTITRNGLEKTITLQYTGSDPSIPTDPITIADRNVGGDVYQSWNDVVYPESWDGKFFQWGNNYGFDKEGFETSLDLVDTSSYGPSQYNNPNFITSYLDDWTTDHNQDLWGYITGTEIARRGPCPEGFHIPTFEEFDNLYKVFEGVYGYGSLLTDNWSHQNLLYIGNPYNFMYHMGSGPCLLSDGTVGSLNNCIYCNKFWTVDGIYDVNGVAPGDLNGIAIKTWPKSYGLPIRPFKNTTQTTLIEYEDAMALYNTDPSDLVDRLNENPEAQYEKFLSEGHMEETHEGGDRMLIGTGDTGEYVLYGVGEWNYHEWYLAG